jgi:hypothetical protein
MSKQTDSLYNIFRKEQARVGDTFEVSYNERNSSLQYRNDKGTMTVIFDMEKGNEDFYFRFKGADKSVGLGENFCNVTNHGESSFMDSKAIARLNKLQPPELKEPPQEFIDLAAEYFYDRKELGFEVEKPKSRNSMER